jgi:glycosyltransferase involved in cell wall biosynthesis
LEAEQLAELGVSGTVHVVPNGITPVAPATAEAIATFCSGYRIKSSSKVILFIGRVMPKKKLEDIIVAFATLRVDFPELLLAIAGNVAQDSAYHRRLVALAIGLGCADQIRWLGFLDEQAKPAALASAAVFVHASESEGMALAILEAMSAGLPIVVSNGCYMREAGAAGALLECAQGAEALANAIRSVLDDASLAATLGKNARAHAAQEHDWDRIAARSLEMYSK